MDYQTRLAKVRKELRRKKSDLLVISGPANIFYLTGFSEIEGYLLVDKKNIGFFTHGIYFQEVLDGRFPYTVNIERLTPVSFYKFINSFSRPSFIGPELSFEGYSALKKKLKKEPVIFPDFIRKIRAIKEKDETALIKKATDIAENVLKKIAGYVRPGTRELDIVAEMKYLAIKEGAEKEGFDPVVASGVNSSYPHHRPQNKQIKNGESVVIDFGVSFHGYKSDLTKTYFAGNPGKEEKNVYGLLLELHERLDEIIRREKSCRKIHDYAVGFLKKKNLDKFFVHGLGHGVGIEIHELPFLNSRTKDFLKKDMIFTLEPGIYLPGKFGIRQEKMVFYNLP